MVPKKLNIIQQNRTRPGNTKSTKS